MQQELSRRPRTLLRAGQVAERLGIGKSSWDRWVNKGLAQKGIMVGARTVVWDSLYIDEIIEDIVSGNFSTEGLYAKKKEAKT
jgi:predicted DNA-binding transcriptional regulator AlpA